MSVGSGRWQGHKMAQGTMEEGSCVATWAGDEGAAALAVCCLSQPCAQEGRGLSLVLSSVPQWFSGPASMSPSWFPSPDILQ